MSKVFSTKKGFTLIEIIIMITIISVGLLAVISALNSGIGQFQKLRERTIATYLAKEGIEAVYNIRETNKSLGNHRLQSDSFNKDSQYLFNNGNYILTTNIYSGQIYFLLSGGNISGLNLSGGINTDDLNFSLCEFSGRRQVCPGQQPQSSQGKFFRSLEGKGLFLKNSTQTGGELIDCPKGNNNLNCENNSAKEFRFCSKVEYISKTNSKVEFCGIITN